MPYSQENICSPTGTECYKNLRQDFGKCLIPCKGVYADVERDIEVMKVEELRKFDKLVKNYEKYKRGNIKDINYPEQLKVRNKTINDIYFGL